jgi:hypothetical protein
MVGPVAHAFEMHKSGKRLTDQEARTKLTAAQWSEPWAQSYTVPAVHAPAITIVCPKAAAGEKACTVAGDTGGNPVALTRLDYHGRPAETATENITSTPTRFAFTKDVAYARELLQVSCGEFRAEIAMPGLWHRAKTVKLGH